MEYLKFEVEVNAWEGHSYEIIARAAGGSARQVGRFPLGPAALSARLPELRRALAAIDLGAGRSGSDEERAVEEFAALLYRFLFVQETHALLEEARSAAIRQWKGLRLRLRVGAPDLQNVPWEALWDILAFDLRTMRRGLFDLRIERIPRERSGSPARATGALHPLSTGGQHHPQAAELVKAADTAFYSPDFARAVGLYEAGLRIEPDWGQARECMTRAETCLARREPRTAVPPRAAAGYSRAWDLHTMYRFDEAARWLDEALLLAKDWGFSDWPEAAAFRRQIESCRAGFANYTEGLARYEEGDAEGALEAVQQALRADPLEVYRAQIEAWGRTFNLE